MTDTVKKEWMSMNSRRYGIGFFVGIFLLSLLYIFSDLRFQSAEDGVRAEEGTAYYLEEEEGKVSIYQGEEHTLYEKTSIPVKQLPAGIQEEIREGKSLSGEGEHFSFLENYSS